MTNEKPKRTELLVIGAGPAGYAAAFHAADLGMEVVLADPEENPGGVCLYRGCIPTKALLYMAKIRHEVKKAASMGMTYQDPEIRVNEIRKWKDGVVKKMTEGLGLLVKKRKIKYIRGKARFKDSRTAVIRLSGDQEEIWSFKKAVIAAGSLPSSLPFAPKDDDRIWHASTALNVPEIPGSLLVVGGGYIGLELGTFYASLGSAVTVVEMTPGLLPGIDRVLVKEYRKEADSLFKAIYTSTQISEIKAQKSGLKITYKGEGAPGKGETFDAVLIAVGRRPQSEDLNLDAAGVTLNDKGFIRVNEQQRTDDPDIYAAGDITGPPLLAHKAMFEGKVAAEAAAGKDTVFDPRAVPAVEYTFPEIAVAGLSADEARAANKKIVTAKFPWAASGRAATMHEGAGMTQWIADADTHRLLGAGIVGAEAGELISEAVLAIEMAAVAEDVAKTIHPHPTLSETLQEAAELMEGGSLHYFQKKRDT